MISNNYLNSLYLFTISIIIPIPFFVKLGGAPIYIIQLSFFSLFFIRSLLLPNTRELSSLDILILCYVLWNCITYMMNIPFVFSMNNPDLIFSQAVSLISFIVFLTPYYVGRHCNFNEKSSAKFIYIIAISYTLVVVYFIISYVKLLPNIYLARELIGQRIPMMIMLISNVLFIYWYMYRRKDLFLLISSLLGLVLVFISLTRAAYIQGAFSLLSFAIYVFKKKHIKILPILAISVFIFASLFFCYSLLTDQLGVDPLILFDRIQQILHPSETTQNDESANVRVSIWIHLLTSLFEHPLGPIFGYGQLGPSYISETFTSLNGEIISNYSAHNQYLDTIIRSGFVGLVLELWIFCKIIIDSISFRPQESQYFFKAVGLSLLGVAFYSIFHESFRYHMFSVFFWFYAGLLAGSDNHSTSNITYGEQYAT